MIAHLRQRQGKRKGQALVEFSIIALVLYLLLAGIIEFGRALYANQVIQQAADLAARELARAPLPPTATFEEALQDEDVRRRIYDRGYLVIDLDNLGGDDLPGYVAKLPAVNQHLYLLMVFEEVGGKRLLRFPGALVQDNTTPLDGMPPVSGFSVSVPVVVSRGGDGAETIEWAPVLEQIKPAGAGTERRDDPFHLLSAQKGIAGVRINYPFQAATLSAYQAQQTWPPEPNWPPLKADDDAVSGGNPPEGALVTPDKVVGPYAGPYGLGKQLALGTELRPFRRLLTAQAVHRREIFR